MSTYANWLTWQHEYCTYNLQILILKYKIYQLQKAVTMLLTNFDAIKCFA